MLTAALLTTVIVSTAGAAPRAQSRDVLSIIQISRGNPPQSRLERLDAVTLVPKRPGLDLGPLWARPDVPMARSPDGSRAVLDTDDETFVVDLRRMRRVAALPVSATLFAWPASHRLVAADAYAREVAVVHPQSGLVLGRHEFGASEVFDARRVRGGVVVLSGAFGAPLRIVQIKPGRRSEVTLRTLWLGIESRSPESRDVLPPRARVLLEEARAAAAAREGVPVSDVVNMSVRPLVDSTALGCPGRGGQFVRTPGYELIVAAAGRLYDYRAGLEWPGVSFCRIASAVPQQNLLRAPRSAGHVTSAALAADARTGRAFVVVPELRLAEIWLGSGRVRVRKVLARLPQGREDAQLRWVGGGRLVYWVPGGEGAVWVSAATGRVTPLAGQRCDVTARAGLVLVHGDPCRGLVGRESPRRRRFSLFGEWPVTQLQRAGRYAYVRLHQRAPAGGPATIHVVDLERGRVVGQVDVSGSTQIVAE